MVCCLDISVITIGRDACRHLLPGHIGSQLFRTAGTGFSNHLMSCADHVNTAQACPCETQAGGVVFFCYGIAHSTQRNMSDHPWAGVAYVSWHRGYHRSAVLSTPSIYPQMPAPKRNSYDASTILCVCISTFCMRRHTT